MVFLSRSRALELLLVSRLPGASPGPVGALLGPAALVGGMLFGRADLQGLIMEEFEILKPGARKAPHAFLPSRPCRRLSQLCDRKIIGWCRNPTPSPCGSVLTDTVLGSR